MRLRMQEKKNVTEVVSKRYQKSRKKEKVKILDEFTEITDYNRAYASYILSSWGQKKFVLLNGKMTIFVLGTGRKKKKKRERPRTYGENIKAKIKKLWAGSGFLCGKMLKGYIKENLDIIENHKEIKLSGEERKKVKKISASTIDRMLRQDKKKMELKKRSGTKPGSLLKDRIPIRTYWEWDENKPGFTEIDLVEHNGGDPSGEYIQTLNSTDIKTCWVEPRAVLNKAQMRVFNALKTIEGRFPFKILGLDSDNGTEFINHHFVKYCDKTRKNFTRSRVNNKNDSCYIEQKNYTVVRKEIGYQRYEGEEELKLLNQIYDKLRLVLNYFTPVRKKISSERCGSKRVKKYDKPRTPYARVMELPEISEEVKERLTAEREQLNPFALRREILALKRKLDRAAEKRRRAKARDNESFKYAGNYVYY